MTTQAPATQEKAQGSIPSQLDRAAVEQIDKADVSVNGAVAFDYPRLEEAFA